MSSQKHAIEVIVSAMREGWTLAQSTKHGSAYLMRYQNGRRQHNNDIGSIPEAVVKKLVQSGAIEVTTEYVQEARTFYQLRGRQYETETL